MSLKESQTVRHSVPQKAIPRLPSRPIFQPRPNANATPRTPNASMPLADRSKMNCHKCGKIGHFASQYMTKPQGFPPGHNFKRPPVRILQEEKTQETEMSQEEVPQGVYEPGDLNKFINNHPENKLSPSWKGPAVIVELQENSNYKILFNDKRIRIRANQLMPYYT